MKIMHDRLVQIFLWLIDHLTMFVIVLDMN